MTHSIGLRNVLADCCDRNSTLVVNVGLLVERGNHRVDRAAEDRSHYPVLKTRAPYPWNFSVIVNADSNTALSGIG